jgi:hypothetical protein
MDSRGRLSYISMLRCVREEMIVGMRQKKNGQIGNISPYQSRGDLRRRKADCGAGKKVVAYLTTRNAGRLPELSSWLFILPCFRAFLTRTPLIKK